MRYPRVFLAVLLGGCSSTVQGGTTAESTGGGANVEDSDGGTDAGGALGGTGALPNAGGTGLSDANSSSCVAPYSTELHDALLLTLPHSFTWQSYSAGPPNADGWSACANTPCGTCSLSWSSVDAGASKSAAHFSGTCAVGGIYNRMAYACTIDLMASDASIELDVTAIYSAANRRIDWVQTGLTLNATWAEGPEHTCDPYGNFNLSEAQQRINDSLQQALEQLTLSYACP